MIHRKKLTSLVTRMDVAVDRHHIPMIIYREPRNSLRISLGHEAVHLRMPLTWKAGLPKDPVAWGVQWTHEKYREKPQIFAHLLQGVPEHGKVYHTIFGEVKLSLLPERRSDAFGKMISDGNLEIRYSQEWDEVACRKIIPELTSKVFASCFLGKFMFKVVELNAEHFRFRIRSIKLKHNKSTWGSCSHSGSLIFSTRLLLAPEPVVDYVIIHELAHLKEHNHGDGFWNLITGVMPDYEEHVGWLRLHGSTLNF